MKPKPTSKVEEPAIELALRQSNARYDELVRRIPVGIYTMRMQADRAARFEYASERFCQMLGVDQQDVLRDAESVRGRIHPDDRASLDEANRRAAQTPAPFRWEGRCRVRGETRWLRVESEPTVLPDEASLWNGVMSDITARRQAEEALRASEDQFRSVFLNAPVGIFHSVWEGRMLAANPALAKLLGYSSPDELVAATSDMTTQIYVDSEIRPQIMGDLQRTDGWVHYDGVLWRRKDGRIITIDMTGRKVLDENGSFAYLEGFIQDITERLDAEGALKRLAERDPLTGILNQRAFHAAATQRIAALGGAHAALVFMDLDGLKEINDRYGHATGDRALATFAQMLGDAFRESDIVGRVGGDEFAVLAVSREVVSDEALLARLRAELRQVGVSGELPCEIAASSGVAWWDASMGTAGFPELVGVADARMYEAKRAKKAAAEPHAD